MREGEKRSNHPEWLVVGIKEGHNPKTETRSVELSKKLL